MPNFVGNLTQKYSYRQYFYHQIVGGLFGIALLLELPGLPVQAQSDLSPGFPKDRPEALSESSSKNSPKASPEDYPQLCQNPDQNSSQSSSQSSDQPDLTALVHPDTGERASHWLLSTSNWIANPEIAAAQFIQELGTQIVIQANISPWPTIHQQARGARVPVIMYHDILPDKEVFFDVTVEEFKQQLESIRQAGATPISLDELMTHLETGKSLPPKPILLTFDDGYAGHYKIVYPLLQDYNYPAVFSIFTDKVEGKIVGRSRLTWAQLREMAADPLVTIAAHSITHPPDLTDLPDVQLEQEILQSKKILEEKLGIPIRYFTYPEGKYDERVTAWVKAAGYRGALTMDDSENRFSNQSKSLLAIDRFGQSGLSQALEQAWGGLQLSAWQAAFDFDAPVVKSEITLEKIPLILISGGKPVTIHADSRYQVQEILTQTETAEDTEFAAGVDGGFFSMDSLDSNQMIGPVLSSSTGRFIPGNASENRKLRDRPLALIGNDTLRFIPFDPNRHNTLVGVEAEMPNLTDAFVGAGFLVRHGQPQPLESFGDLFDVNEPRHRAFWGVHGSGQPIIGVSAEPVGSVMLGQLLVQAGFREAVMLDSGASTSLAQGGESLVGYTPRPVPHVVALVSHKKMASRSDCTIARLSSNQSR